MDLTARPIRSKESSGLLDYDNLISKLTQEFIDNTLSGHQDTEIAKYGLRHVGFNRMTDQELLAAAEAASLVLRNKVWCYQDGVNYEEAVLVEEFIGKWQQTFCTPEYICQSEVRNPQTWQEEVRKAGDTLREKIFIAMGRDRNKTP